MNFKQFGSDTAKALDTKIERFVENEVSDRVKPFEEERKHILFLCPECTRVRKGEIRLLEHCAEFICPKCKKKWIVHLQTKKRWEDQIAWSSNILKKLRELEKELKEKNATIAQTEEKTKKRTKKDTKECKSTNGNTNKKQDT